MPNFRFKDYLGNLEFTDSEEESRTGSKPAPVRLFLLDSRSALVPIP
jgi:hypothetical protein